MAKDKLSDYDGTTASNNTDIGGVSIAEGMLPSNVNNSMRELTKQLGAFADGTDGVDVLKLQDDTDTNSIKLQAPASVTATTTFTLPDGDGTADQVLKTDGSGQLGFADRHPNPSLIINGAMTIHQRGGTISSSATGPYSLDRFRGYSSGGGVFSMEQSTTVPNNEFAYSNKLTVTTEDSSIASSDFYAFNHHVEGYNIIQTGYGTSDAKTLTLSFWVRSSITGTYSVTAYNSDGSRGYLNTFSISSADTWTKISLSWAGDTGGTWNKTNGQGITIRFDLGSGSSGYGTADQWTTSGTFTANRTSGSVDWIATSGATFYITGVKLEVGSTATDFVHEDYGTTLRKCQRYYYRIQEGVAYQRFATHQCVNSNNGYAIIHLPVSMRQKPSLHTTGTASNYAIYENNGVNACSSLISINSSGSNTDIISINANSTGNLAGGNAATLLANNNATVFLAFNAEL